MDNKKVPLNTPKNIGDRSKKASYSKPILRVFGSVSKLTTGGSGSVADGASTMVTRMARN